MSSIDLKKVGQWKALAVLKKAVRVSDVWHARLSNAARQVVKWMADKDIVPDMDMSQGSDLDDCSLCSKGTMTNRLMTSRTHVEVRRGAEIHTNVAVMSLPLIGGAKYYTTFINEASGHLRAFHMKAKGEADKLRKREVCWVKWRYRCMVMKIALNCGGDYAKGPENLETQGIEAHLTAS